MQYQFRISNVCGTKENFSETENQKMQVKQQKLRKRKTAEVIEKLFKSRKRYGKLYNINKEYILLLYKKQVDVYFSYVQFISEYFRLVCSYVPWVLGVLYTFTRNT